MDHRQQPRITGCDDVGDVAKAVGEIVRKPFQLRWSMTVQRSNQNGVNRRKDCGVGANPKGERKDR
ncbi:MAG: hypothetical protein DMF97_19195, partial [Acidobacteria bacterium]